MTAGVTIRYAAPDDELAIARLAALDSATRPPGTLLLAEVGDEARAALSLETGAVVADPFQPTLDLVELLRQRAAQLTRPPLRRRGPLRALAARVAEL